MLAQTEVTSEEATVDAGVRAAWGARGRLQLLWGNTLFHADEVPFAADMSDLPDVFTPFRNKARLPFVIIAPLLREAGPAHACMASCCR